MKKLGEFIDLLGQTKNSNGRFWLLWELPEKIGPAEWKHARSAPFVPQTVLELAEVIRTLISERLNDISTDELYKDTKQEGHAFLQEIYRLATEHGIEVTLEEIDMPLTPTEMMAAAGYVRVTETGQVELTEQGIRAAEDVQRQIDAAKSAQGRAN